MPLGLWGEEAAPGGRRSDPRPGAKGQRVRGPTAAVSGPRGMAVGPVAGKDGDGVGGGEASPSLPRPCSPG